MYIVVITYALKCYICCIKEFIMLKHCFSFLFILFSLTAFSQNIRKVNPDASGKTESTLRKENTQADKESKIDTLKVGEPQKNGAFTIGFLQGGGGLLGMDIEIRLKNKLTMQAGLGINSAGAGLNIHFKERINSSYVSLMLWNQGFNENHFATLVGPSIVFRTKKVFTASIGYGSVLASGPAMPDEFKGYSGFLTYSIGIFFPL